MRSVIPISQFNCLVVDYLFLLLLIGIFMMLAGENLAAFPLNQLIQRYQKQKENPVAFELLERYKQCSHQQKGEIIWSLLAPHQSDLSKIVASMNEDPQEELQRLFLKLHTLFMKGKFPHSNWKYWLARILKNDLLNKKTRKGPVVSLPVEHLPEVETDEPYQEYDIGKLTSAIHQLNDTQRKVIELRYLKRREKLMTYKEIAEEMNCTVGQVHGYIDRAKLSLRKQLQKDISYPN